MLLFTSFLFEEAHTMQVEKPLVHLMHPEDAIIDHGHDGVHIASNFLDAAHQHLSGQKNDVNWSVKHDGTSLVFGHDPHDKQLFVGTKSIFNKNPKINKTPEDIINNHGNKPEVADSLLTSLKHIHKIMPEGGKEVFQGDLMHTKKDRETDKSHVHFKRNTIKYSAPKDSPEGAKAHNAHMGIAIHTKYTPEGVAMPIDDKDRRKFKDHPHVHNISTGFKPKIGQYTTGDMKNYIDLKDQATKHYRSMPPDVFDSVKRFVPQIHKYINHEVRREGQPTARGFADYLHQLHSVRMDGIKSPKWARERVRTHSGELSDVLGNAHNLDKVFKLHTLLGGAKNVLTDAMARSSPFSHSIDGEPTGPEGIVAVAPTGSAVKFVKRHEFSRLNFHNGKHNDKV